MWVIFDTFTGQEIDRVDNYRIACEVTTTRNTDPNAETPYSLRFEE